MLGGRFGLGDGGWAGSTVADALPVTLPSGKNTFHRDHATPELSGPGTNSLITRLDDDPIKNAEKWKKLPFLMDYQDPGTPKPGAVVLAEMNAGGRTMPMLITENFGRGRTAVLATSGTWRWQMAMPLGDPSHDAFWRQLLRWVVNDTPGNVVASVPSQMLFDDGRIRSLRRCARQGISARARRAGASSHLRPDGIAASVDMTPTQDVPGSFQAGLERRPARPICGRGHGEARRSGAWAATCSLFSAWTESQKIFTPNRIATCSKSFLRRPAARIGVRKIFRSSPAKSLCRKPASQYERRKSCGICRLFSF